MSEVKLFQSDTSMTPFDSGTYGSRVTFLAGNATRNAAVDAKRKLLAAAGEKWGVDPHTLKCKGRQIISEEDPQLSMSISDCAVLYMQNHNGEEVTGVGAYFHDVDPKPVSYTHLDVYKRQIGKELTEETVSLASEAAMRECSPIGDVRASSAYRKDMVRVFTRRTIKMAMEQ